MNICRSNPELKHCKCDNFTCPDCGYVACCWCGNAKPIEGATTPPCDDCQAEIDSDEVAIQ